MFKRAIFLGLTSGILAGIASLVYQQVYNTSLGSDFSSVANSTAIMIASIAGCLLAGLGFWVLNKWMKAKGEIVFNFVFTLLSFASILPAFAATFPLTMETDPALFPGFAIPMHFFPVVAWFTVKPLFIKS